MNRAACRAGTLKPNSARAADSLSVALRRLDPDVNVAFGVGKTVVGDCVTSNDEILDLMIVEQLQQFAEFGRNLDRSRS